MHPINDLKNIPPEAFEEEDLSPEKLASLYEMYGDHDCNKKKQELPIVWDRYKDFSPAFLSKYHDFVICDLFHRIQAFLLYPPNCSCDHRCRCPQLREKIALTLNTRQYTAAQKFEPPDRLQAMKNICHIPEDHVFRELYAEAYPLENIQKEWETREKNGDFKSINQLVWTFLRLGQTYDECIGVKEVSLKEAVGMILGDTPLKTKARNNKEGTLRGEKAYEKLFKHYTSVCHFIAALEYCKKEVPGWESLFTNAVYVPLVFTESFLNVAHWFRKNLLTLERRNVKGKVFLEEEDLFPLPDWIPIEEIDLPIEPFEEKVKEILSNALHIDPVTKTVTKVNLYEERAFHKNISEDS